MIEADHYPPPGEFMNPLDVGLFDLVKNGWFNAETREVFTGFAVGPGDVVADIGCGEGGYARFCARMGAEVIVTDLRADRIEALTGALAGSAARVSGHVCDCADLAIADGAANRIICTEVLEHVTDPAAVMAELVRIGEPDALYLLSVPDAQSEAMFAHVAKPSYFAAPNHVRAFDSAAFKGLVEGAGLIVERTAPQGFYWSLYLSALWASQRDEPDPGGEAYDQVGPPFPEFGQRLARLWFELASMPSFDPVRTALDALLPKTQVIVARKPGGAV